MYKLDVASFIQIQVAELFGWSLTRCNLVIIENNPSVSLLDMTHIMSALWGIAHMTHEGQQIISWFSICEPQSRIWVLAPNTCEKTSSIML